MNKFQGKDGSVQSALSIVQREWFLCHGLRGKGGLVADMFIRQC